MMAQYCIQRLRHIFRTGLGDSRPIDDLDAGIFSAWIWLHSLQLRVEECDVHRQFRIAGRPRYGLAQEFILESHARGSVCLAIKHWLDEVGVLSEDTVILPDEGGHKRSEEVHADLEAAAPEAVRDSRHRAADETALGLEVGRRNWILESKAQTKSLKSEKKEYASCVNFKKKIPLTCIY